MIIKLVFPDYIEAKIYVATNYKEAMEKIKYFPNSLWHHELAPRFLNKYGTIGPEFKMPKPNNTYRVICLGDSTSEYVGHHPEWLQKKMNGKIFNGKKIEIINAGIANHCSAFTLQYFALKLIHFKPDMVILKIGYNDYLPFGHENLAYDYTPAYPEPLTIDRSDKKYWKVAKYSFLLKTIGALILDLPCQHFSANIWKIGKNNFKDNYDKMYLYIENIKSIIYLCQNRNIKICILDLPTAPKIVEGFDENDYLEFMNRINADLKKTILQMDYVDYLETKNILANNDFSDHCHLRPIGGEKISNLIVQKYFTRDN